MVNGTPGVSLTCRVQPRLASSKDVKYWEADPFWRLHGDNLRSPEQQHLSGPLDFQHPERVPIRLRLGWEALRHIAVAGSSEIGSGLAYDTADNTLWMFNWGGNRLEQYSKDGNPLSTISGINRIYGLEFAVVPEPSALALVGTAAVLVLVRRAGYERRGY